MPSTYLPPSPLPLVIAGILGWQTCRASQSPVGWHGRSSSPTKIEQCFPEKRLSRRALASRGRPQDLIKPLAYPDESNTVKYPLCHASAVQTRARQRLLRTRINPANPPPTIKSSCIFQCHNVSISDSDTQKYYATSASTSSSVFHLDAR
ncbi:hypothetical protein FB451DRAFT_1414720 [Mycena latifolia]|nr:hypothetical protein FB451DRAFT_1414720 [Mycena latifolia]